MYLHFFLYAFTVYMDIIKIWILLMKFKATNNMGSAFDKPKPYRTVVWKTITGEIIKTPCDCPDKIPGLEADCCLTCRICWLDEQTLDQVRHIRF